MTSVRRCVSTTGLSTADMYDALVGDHSCGFWMTFRSDGSVTTRLGVAEVADAGDAPFGTASRRAGDSTGGWVGWIGYEPDASAWLRADRYVSVDHSSDTVWAHAPENEIDSWSASVRNALRTMAPVAAVPAGRATRAAHARHSPERYRAMIESARDAIRAGDVYQLCLTTRFTVDGPVDPRAVHAELRQDDAPFTALIRAGDRALVASSPEQFVHLRASGNLSTSPIKGTRARSSDAAEDALLAAELERNAKERAENLMIVDLMRNDISRVCVAGSVAVARLFDVESHTHVHQLVSEVTGQVCGERGRADVLNAMFPAGSMTGAPKPRAMQIIADLEGGARGAYSGCFGWVGDDGSMDLAMAIRSVVIDANGAFVGAGGGLTIDSCPEDEIDEVMVKARAPLAALGARAPASWESRGRR